MMKIKTNKKIFLVPTDYITHNLSLVNKPIRSSPKTPPAILYCI